QGIVRFVGNTWEAAATSFLSFSLFTNPEDRRWAFGFRIVVCPIELSIIFTQLKNRDVNWAVGRAADVFFIIYVVNRRNEPKGQIISRRELNRYPRHVPVKSRSFVSLNMKLKSNTW